VALAWDGGIPAAAALDRLLAGGADVALALPEEDGPVPRFLLEEQAAALRLPLAEGPATARPGPASGLGGLRAFVCACRPPLSAEWLGRFVDEPLLADARAMGVDLLAPGAAAATLVVEGPRFSRRVEAMAGDVAPHAGGWRLDLGLRGC